MVTGGFRSVEVMDLALNSGKADVIGMGRPFIIDPEFPAKLLSGVCDSAPSVERNFPAAEEVPKGAVLNWFCDQLALYGISGNGDSTVPLIEGHERYLATISAKTEKLLETRKQSQSE